MVEMTATEWIMLLF